MIETSDTIQFSGFRLDLRRRELTRHGQRVPLQDRAFDMLTYLIERRQDPVSRDDILSHVWRGIAVSENNLSVQLSALRKALAEAGCNEPLIVTLPNKCYRFVGELEVADSGDGQAETVVEPAAKPPNGSRKSLLLAIGLGALLVASSILMLARLNEPGEAVAPRLSMVVLPFRNTSADRTQDYLADAVTDDLTADLAHYPESTVIARQSAEALQHETPQRIGADLKVRYLLSGTLFPEEAGYHIVASLIDTATGRELWTASFDPSRDWVSEVRKDIVARIASRLHLALDRLENARSLADRSSDPDALDLFFRARSLLDGNTTLATFQTAQNWLEQAIAKQPDFVDAKAELALMLLRKITLLDDPNDIQDFGEAKRLIAQALADSPDNTKALTARSRAFQIDGDCASARQFAERALSLEPSSIDVRVVLASCAQASLKLDEAIAYDQSILRLDPDNPANKLRHLALGTLRLVQGHPESAIDELALAQNDDAMISGSLEPAEQARLMLIAAYELDGQHSRARSEYDAYAERYKLRTAWRIGAYFPHEWRGLDGMRRVVEGLQKAGMPAFAKEHDAVLPDGLACADETFGATPATLPGGIVVTTSELAQALTTAHPPLIIDIGPGIAPPPSAVLYDASVQNETEEDFAIRIARQRIAVHEELQTFIMGPGPVGCRPYLIARKLILNGFRHVGWYRGGEEAWSQYQLSRQHN